MKYFGRRPGLVKRGRYLKENKVPFVDILPLQLKQSVSGKSIQGNRAQCVQEMSVLFACLKRNNFEETHCGPEMQAFKKCFSSTLASNASSQQQQGQALTFLQLNAMLKKFP